MSTKEQHEYSTKLGHLRLFKKPYNVSAHKTHYNVTAPETHNPHRPQPIALRLQPKCSKTR